MHNKFDYILFGLVLASFMVYGQIYSKEKRLSSFIYPTLPGYISHERFNFKRGRSSDQDKIKSGSVFNLCLAVFNSCLVHNGILLKLLH